MSEPIRQAAAQPAAADKAEASPQAKASRVTPSRQPDKEVVYKKTPQGELKLHFYLPADWKNADSRPAIVFFFGGGWTGGSPKQFFAKGEYFAGRGIVAVSAEYRIRNLHQTTPDKCVEDARSAMRYVRKHAGRFGIDPQRIISAGGSAGGHLAACVALCEGPDSPDDDLTISCRPQAMVLFNPVLDLGGEKLLAKVKESHPEMRTLITRISPIEYLRNDCPPAIVFFGTADWFLPQGQGFIEKSLALGNTIELWTAEGMPHAFFNASPWHEATTIAADRFLASLGYLAGPPTMKPADEKSVMKKELPKAG